MIHETAVIGEKVQLGTGVSVGPYTVIDGEVTIGDGCTIGPHCHITGYTTIGAGTCIHKGAVIGDDPQDFGFDTDCVSYCRIGENCMIREYVTIHRGTKPDSATVIGDTCMLMGFVHIAHNCQVGNHCVLANAAILAGYVEVGDRAFLSTEVGVHQFVHIGEMAMLSHRVKITQDITPYTMVVSEEGVAGINIVGLRRAGFDGATRSAIKNAIKILHHSGKLRADAVAQIQESYGDVEPVKNLLDFIEKSTRGLHTGKG